MWNYGYHHHISLHRSTEISRAKKEDDDEEEGEIN